MPYSKDFSQIFLNNVVKEMALYFKKYGKLSVDSIFFGGGTPNVLPKKLFSALFSKLHSYFNVVDDVEITMEMNPGIHSKSKLDFFKHLGINRVSIGVQSFKNHVLTDYGRNHTVDETKGFIEDVLNVGFKNISADIIFGHSDHNMSDLDYSLKVLLDYKFNHLSLYGLTIEKHTPFYEQGLTIDDDFQAGLYSFIQDTLKISGYNQYEVSNFSIPGYESRHNIKYWTFKPTIGLGAGAHSYFMGYRYSNNNDFRYYIDNLDVILPNKKNIQLDIYEYLAVRLRYKSPIYFNFLKDLFGVSKVKDIKKKLIEINRSGYIDMNTEFFTINENGFALLDEVLCHLV